MRGADSVVKGHDICGGIMALVFFYYLGSTACWMVLGGTARLTHVNSGGYLSIHVIVSREIKCT